MKTLVFDTETTDLISAKMMPLHKQPRIIEFFGLSIDEEGNEISEHHFLFDPEQKLSQTIKSITKIDDEMLKGQPKFSEKAEEIKSLLESHNCIVAHNLSFDRTMVELEMRRCSKLVKWSRLICTVESTEHIKGYRLNLNALHEFLFGEEFTGAHRAEQDVRALARCYVELKKREIV
jgi:DNA polymerase III epsilon subunit-like protein